MPNVNKQLACVLIPWSRPVMVMSSLRTGSHPRAGAGPPVRSSSSMATTKTIIREVEGDLFRASHRSSLAHCVSSDMKMGAGIAVYFRKKFGRVTDLLKQNKSVGEVAYLKEGSRFIFYLVTKQRFYDKPTEVTMHHSLLEMKDKCEKLGVTQLAMPRIGCGLDGLKWPLVFRLVQEVFSNSGMEVTIYSIPDSKFKTMTPTILRTQERFRDFFDTRKAHSLPACAMTSKRKHSSDSFEEEFETPKKRKVSNSNLEKKSLITGDEFDIQSSSSKKTSSFSKSFGIVPLPHMAKGNEIPFLSDQDEDESSKDYLEKKSSSRKVEKKPASSDSEEDSIPKKSVKKSSHSKSKPERSRRAPSPNLKKSRLMSDYMVKPRRSFGSSRHGKEKSSPSRCSEEFFLASQQHPKLKKKLYSSDSSSSFDEDNLYKNERKDDNSDMNSSTEASSDEKNIVKKKIIIKTIVKKENTSVRRTSRQRQQSSDYYKSSEQTSPKSSRGMKKSSVSEKKGLSDRFKSRLAGEADESMSRKQEYSSLNIRKEKRKSSKSPPGTMYSDRQNARTSVKARLSLGHKLKD